MKTARLQDYKCPRCHDNYGFIFLEKDKWIWFCGTPECMRDDAKSSLRKSDSPKFDKCSSMKFGVGTRYYNAHVSKLRIPTQWIEQIQNWIHKSKDFLVVTGVPGVGKTYFCVAIANLLIENKKIVNYTNTRRYFEDIQNSISENKSQYEKIRKYSNFDILIFDDLGASTGSEWQKEVLLDLIDNRYSEKKPTIITSNLNESDMTHVLGERISRRVFDKDNLKITLTV